MLTHHAREPLHCQGATTFTFVTDGIESALDQAEAAAAGGDVSLAGGAQVVSSTSLQIWSTRWPSHLVPIFLGEGERLFDNLGAGNPRLTHVERCLPGVTHLSVGRS